MKSHSDIDALVARIRRETGCVVPDVDPAGAGAGARVAMIMLTPGPAEGGAQITRILSPTTNSDQSALNLRKLMHEAGLSESICVFWNAVPWSLDRRRDPTPQELARGVIYLKEFLALLPQRRAVVALGRVAQQACSQARVTAVNVPSPSPLAVAQPASRPNPKSTRWLEIREGLRQAVALASR